MERVAVTNRRWWVRFNADLDLLSRTDNSNRIEPLSAEVQSLLADVSSVRLSGEETRAILGLVLDARYTGSESAAPDATGGEIIVGAKHIAKWFTVLQERGWGTAEPTVFHGLQSADVELRSRKMIPTRRGASALSVFHYMRRSDKSVSSVFVAVGNPIVTILTLYDGDELSDADNLLEDIDKRIVSVVDGSFSVTRIGPDFWIRTSFYQETVSVLSEFDPDTTVSGRPWVVNWIPRTIHEG